jgi:hypothetical protein
LNLCYYEAISWFQAFCSFKCSSYRYAAAMREKLSAAVGRDEKGLSAETEAARVAVSERVALEKKLAAAKLAEENAEIREKLSNATVRLYKCKFR